MTVKKTSQLDPEPKYGEPLDDDELLRYHWYLYDLSKSYFGGEQRKEHRRLQDMYFGKTLTAAEVDYLTGQGRVPINFNFFCGTVNALVGTEAGDRKECVFKPDDEDPDQKSTVIADWMTMICRKQTVACDGPRTLSDAFQDCLITGTGFTHVYLDVSRMPMRVVLKPALETECFPDPDSREHNYNDGQFLIWKQRLSLEEIQARWPDKAAEVEAAAGSGALPSIAPTENVDGIPQKGARPNRRAKLAIYHLEYWRPAPRKVWYDPETGARMDTSPEELAAREKELAAQLDPTTGQPSYTPVQEFTYSGRSYWSAWIAGDEKTAKGGIVLEHQQSTVPSFTSKVVTGFRYKDYDKERLQYFGIGLLIAYAQLYLDKALRMWLEIVDRGSKGGGYIEGSALPGDFQTFVKEISKPGGWTLVTDGTIAEERIKERDQPRTPDAYDKILQLCRDAMAGLSSVTDLVKGTAETERSNVLVTNLQGQSRTMWGPLFESYTAYVMDVGKLVVAISLKHLPDVEIDRLIGPVQVEDLTHTKTTDPATGKDAWQPIMVPATTAGAGQPCQDCGGTGTQGIGMGGMMMQGGMGASAAGQQCPTCQGKGRVQPATPSYYLKQEDPFLYKVTVDVGQSSPTARNAFWQIFQQGIGKMLTDLGVEASDILPIMAQNMPLPGTQAAELSKRIEATLAKKEQLQAPQGIAAALQGLGPQGAQQVIEQVAQALKLDLGGQDEPEQKPPLKITGRLEDMTPDEQAQALQQVGINANPNRAAMVPPPDNGVPQRPPGAPSNG